MYGDNHRDDALREAWHSFCDELKLAGDIIYRDNTPNDSTTRATGLRLLARNMALALQFQMENDDPLHPELLHYFDPLRKQGGDNADALYVGAPINGTDTYRISGKRGTARYFAVTVLENGDTPWGGQVVGSLFGPDIDVDDNGDFELLISPQPQSGNWIQSTPGSFRVTVRQFFADWENEQPMRARIDRLEPTGSAPAPLSIERISTELNNSVHWLRWSTHYWAEQLDKWQAQPNAFFAYNELDPNSIDATPGGLPLIAYWQVQPDEALIVRVTPPAADYWSVEFGNYWWETMDYRYRLCSTNCHYAQLEDNGELLVVISHRDPGHPNWMDCAGYPEGYITYRWIGSDAYPRPAIEKLHVDELPARLKDCKSINAEQRREQLARRRRGVINRFGS